MVKNTLKSILLLLIVIAILPSGPTDLFIIPYIIERIGMQGYIILSIVLVIWLYKSVEGMTLKDKFNTIKREIKQVIS